MVILKDLLFIPSYYHLVVFSSRIRTSVLSVTPAHNNSSLSRRLFVTSMLCQPTWTKFGSKSIGFQYFLPVSPRNFYFADITSGIAYSYKVQIMFEEVDSNARQLEVQSEIETLTLTELIMAEDINYICSGLYFLRNRIIIPTIKCPQQIRSHQDKLWHFWVAFLS